VCPFAARAQQPERVRRVGVLNLAAADHPESQGRHTAFMRGLQGLGWIEHRNVHIDARWGGGDIERMRKLAAELVALSPDVIVATGSVVMQPLLQLTRTVPIVFVIVPDPVAAGYVASLSHPGGNATGFTNFEFGLAAKWLELLKEIAPSTTRAMIFRDPTITAGIGQFAAIQSASPSIRVVVNPANVGDAAEIENAVAVFAKSTKAGGLIVTASPGSTRYRDVFVKVAARHNMPAVYFTRHFVDAGGLISYGPDFIDQYRRAAGYVDRILKGEKPADLPVQAPVKYETVINLKTAKALGIVLPPTVLARADEVIE
jgi:putative ABC transport system substrate-binding protein